MKYLLDTDAFSDIVRGNTHVEWRFSRTPLSTMGISSVTVKEIEYGRRLNPIYASRRGAAIESLLRRIDPDARQAPSFRSGKDSADSEAVVNVNQGFSAARCIGARY